MEIDESSVDRPEKLFPVPHKHAKGSASSFRSRAGKSGNTVSLSSGSADHDNEENDYDTSKHKNRPLVTKVTEPLTRFVSLTQSGNQLSFRNICQLCCKFVVRNPQLLWVLAVLWCFIRFHGYCVYKYTRLFGENPMEGGRYGRWIDETIVQYVLADNYEKRRLELQDIGVDLPDFRNLKEVLTINTKAALREVLIRREARGQKLLDLEDVAENYERFCLTSQDKNSVGHLPASHDALSGRGMPMTSIPNVVYFPQAESWLPPRPGIVKSDELLYFTAGEMRDTIAQFCPKLQKAYDSLNTFSQKVNMWSICTIYTYGGVYVGNKSSISIDSLKEVLKLISIGRHSKTPNANGDCFSPFGIATFEKRVSVTENSDFLVEISLLAATPRHPHLLCLIDKLGTLRGADAVEILETFFTTKSWRSSLAYESLQDSRGMENRWEELSIGGVRPENEHCGRIDVKALTSLPLRKEHNGKTSSQMFVRVKIGPQTTSGHEKGNSVRSKVVVRERRVPEVPLPLPTKKVPLESQMQAKGVQPGWFCSRCLKASIFGTYEKCSAVCPSGYEELVCRDRASFSKRNITIDVGVRSSNDSDNDDRRTRRIPRIIHQTWHSPVDSDRYPQLKRLQNSWLNSGWEYRFYTDDDARTYIAENYPERFLRAFDDVIPGAYKADLFRYLVLLKDGGVYADVDILLDSNLDHFVTPDLSFFAPRDIVGEYANEPFCLWNGFIGSSAGHPFLLRAVERLMNLISRRADLYDMEQDLCRRQGRTTEAWKVRAEPLLLFSGPCALGAAVNDVLGRPSLNKFEIGWLPSNYSTNDYGDALVLVGDKFDLGAFRFSDPERDLIIASTDLAGVNKEPREDAYLAKRDERMHKVRRPSLPHYSSTAAGHEVWGTHNVYVNDFVNHEEIQISLLSNLKENQDSSRATLDG